MSKKIANSLEDNEKIALSLLSNKLNQAAQIYPKDYTINMANNIIVRMSDNNKLFISRAELKDMYNKLYSRNTKFADVFREELGEQPKIQEIKTFDRSNAVDVNQITYETLIDPVLAHDLNLAFDKDSKGYNEKTAAKALKICEREFNSLGLDVKVDVKSGNGECILCSASIETPKGLTTVFVPVEIKNANIVPPSIFIGNDGAEELTKEKFVAYVSNNVGKRLTAAISTIKNASEITSVDLALNRLNALKEKEVFVKNANVEPYTELAFPSYVDVNDEMKSFAANLETPYGTASFIFGKDKVKIANDVIANKLIGLGLDNAQISINSNDESSITYAVSANNGQMAFYVPVKISDGKVYDPTYVIANGGIEALSRDGMVQLAKKYFTDNKAAALASPLQHMRPGELVEKVREFVSVANYTKAEEALNVLMQSDDEKAYKVALNEYVNGLGGVEVKKEASRCNRIVRHAHSTQEICGHTNLPLSKVFQDKFGQCSPLYRKTMEDSTDGAYFMSSKIFI